MEDMEFLNVLAMADILRVAMAVVEHGDKLIDGTMPKEQIAELIKVARLAVEQCYELAKMPPLAQGGRA